MAKPAEKQRVRREEVADAALAVIARDGLEKTSLRAIAAEMGCTLGVITHYFPSRDALLRLVLAKVGEEMRASFDAHPVETPDDLIALLHDILPTDADSLAGWKVWHSFAVLAADRPALRMEHAAEYRRILDRVEDALGQMQARGGLAPGIDVAAEAEALVCFIDGIGLHAVIMPDRMTPSRQRAISHRFVTTLAARKE